MKSIFFDILRRLHNYYYRLLMLVESVFSKKKVECNACWWRGNAFCHIDCWYWHIYRDSTCPWCASQPRHRSFLLYFKTILPTKEQVKLLHFAPEKYLTNFFKKYPNIQYLSVDINARRAMRQEDITHISFPENSFDFILCSHVLEHVPEDHKGMQELYRVLSPGWKAIIDVPIDFSREETYEDRSIVGAAERTKAYWQWDHVRLYGKDFPNKLADVGFLVKSDTFILSQSGETIQYFGLMNTPIYVCQK